MVIGEQGILFNDNPKAKKQRKINVSKEKQIGDNDLDNKIKSNKKYSS